MAEWRFDEGNPGGSGLFTDAGTMLTVPVKAFSEVLAALPANPALVKMDVEGAEFEILQDTPRAAWEGIPAISLEIHQDPERHLSPEAFLSSMRGLGFTVEQETVCSFFLRRSRRDAE